MLRGAGSAAAGARSALGGGAAVRQRDRHARPAAAAPRPRPVSSAPSPPIPSRTRWRASCSPSTRRIRAPPRPSTSSPPRATTSASTPPTCSRASAAPSPTPGLYKDSDRLAVKDDRRPLKQSEYLYQGDVTAKINALTVELAAAEEAYQKARRVADDIAAQRQQWRDRAAACKAICEQYPQWSQIDTETADGHADRLREQYELLLADHPDIEALNARAEECWSQIQKFMTRRGAIQTRRDEPRRPPYAAARTLRSDCPPRSSPNR